jgi:hypothetical protein
MGDRAGVKTGSTQHGVRAMKVFRLYPSVSITEASRPDRIKVRCRLSPLLSFGPDPVHEMNSRQAIQ